MMLQLYYNQRPTLICSQQNEASTNNLIVQALSEQMPISSLGLPHRSPIPPNIVACSIILLSVCLVFINMQVETLSEVTNENLIA